LLAESLSAMDSPLLFLKFVLLVKGKRLTVKKVPVITGARAKGMRFQKTAKMGRRIMRRSHLP
jgi:hypothetical protein